MYTDVSIDLETLGVRPGSVITQIGLVGFNRRPNSGGTAAKSGVQIIVNPQSAIDAGFHLDWSTISWWLKQDEGARMGMADQKGHDIESALYRVGDWFAEHFRGNVKPCVWGHGCGFDCTQLEIAFQKFDIPVPWDFRYVRDLRTLADLIPAMHVERPVPTEAHNALSDAFAQADWIQRLTYQIERREVHNIQEAAQG